MQSRAVLEALGERGAAVPVTTWEPAVGHALAATGILGIAHAVLALEASRIAPVCGMETLDEECRLRYVLEDGARLEGDAVLLSTVGFGGQNGATIIARAAPAGGGAEDADDAEDAA